ncbi:MAG: phosphoribosylanthranilate isomerase [Oscillospiraceae bacterium]
MTRVKICGLSRPPDIEAVNRIRPDYCGFVIDFPKSRRNVSPETASALRAGLSTDIVPVGVFVDKPVEAVAELLNAGIISVAQLHGGEDSSYIASLRRLASGTVWQAFQIRTREDAARAAESAADFVLLDAGQGAGKAFDWELIDGFPRPFGLAGGLNIENLPGALCTRAALLDVSGGVETGGVKDPAKIAAFVAAVRRNGGV